jgi:acyl-coenzyme A thioesterase PaaI-like protein
VSEPSLQERHAPANRCFGCGPANPEGLRIRSFVAPDGGSVVAEWMPETRYEAFPGVLNGGIVGTLFDCHCNWTAIHHLMRATEVERAPCTVTAEFAVKLKRPTDSRSPVQLRAWVVEAGADRAVVEAELTSNGHVTATCRGTFVAVKPGHPAYHRW